ncbi:MAG TPA: DUF3352 domain-containing protein [Anaerolineales bacterium]|nr:DUF3352 domain-containing protein [Anaerolineales bacterium]
METMDDIYPEPAGNAGRGRTPLIATCTVLVLLSCCCALGAGLIVTLDPFDWNLVARLTGRYDAAAEAIPAEADVYIGIDLLRLQSADAERVFQAFAERVPGSEFSSTEDFLHDLDEEMERDAGFNLTDDVLPWVGQHAGLGIMNLELDEFGEIDTGEFIFAAAIRDRVAAEAFAVLFEDRIETESGETLQAEEYEGSTIYSLPGYQGSGIAFAIHRGMFLLSPDAAGIRASIDARSGDSFMDTENFSELSGELPREALLTVFASQSALEKLAGSLGQGIPSTSSLYSNVPFLNGALSLSFVAEGIRVDYAVKFDPESLSEPRRQQLDLITSATTIDARLPETTLLFVGGRGLPLAIELAREKMSASERGAFDESLDALEAELGFSLANDLLANLDGEYAIAALPSRDGMLASREIDLGIAVLFETGNPAGLDPVLDGIERLLEDELGTAPDPVDLDGTAFFQVGDPFLGELLAYGVVNDLFLIATSARTAAEVLREGPSLAENPEYQAAGQVLPDRMNRTLYVNVSGLLGAIREGMSSSDRESFDNEIGSALSPIDIIAMGSRLAGPWTRVGTLIFLIPGGSEGDHAR